MAKWILACKELNAPAWTATTTYTAGKLVSFNGFIYRSVDTNTNQRPPNAHWTTLSGAGIYISRLPKTVDSHTPGVPSVYFFVGPGARPSIQEYSANLFVLTFDYLSHLFCRVVDVNTWPPTEVQPIQISGGPNPPTAFQYNIQLTQDALTLKTEGQDVVGLTAPFFNPPVLQQPIVFVDPITNTYSVTIQTVPGWVPQISANLTPFYRVYRRTFSPTFGPWVLVSDWTTGPLNVVDTNVGSLRFQYTATWGTQFDPTDPFNPSKHMEGVPGEFVITVDSNVPPLGFQFFLSESLTLKYPSYVVAPFFDHEQQFLQEVPEEIIQLSRSSIGKGGDSFVFVGTRSGFPFFTTAAGNNSAADTVTGGFLITNSASTVGGNALAAVMG